MIVNKYTGETKEKAIEAAKEAMGDAAVISSAKSRKPEGILGIFKPSIWEVTAFLEEDTDGSVTLKKEPILTSKFSAAADERINIQGDGEEYSKMTAENELKDAFRQISQVFKEAEDKESKRPAAVTGESVKTEEIPLEKKPENLKEKPVGTISAQNKPVKGGAVGNLPIVRMVYNTLIDNEVDEKYINQIFADMGNLLSSAGSLDILISNIYQKMVLKLGKPSPISLQGGKDPLVVFFVGPTGVGKTTTIAKIASAFIVNDKKKVSFITADTFRMAAAEQLHTYANILEAPIEIIYGANELNDAVESLRDQDLILVDTVGFSHKNTEQRNAAKELLSALDEKYKRAVFLVLSITTKYVDLREIADSYREICDYRLIFTKLDETKSFGNILNMKLYTNAPLSYVTTGQRVPDDIETIDPQKFVRAMLGG